MIPIGPLKDEHLKKKVHAYLSFVITSEINAKIFSFSVLCV